MDFQPEFWHWWALAGTLLIAEVAFPTAVLVAPAVAAIIIGVIAAIFDIGLLWQLFLWAAITLPSMFAWKKYLKRRPVTDQPTLNRKGDQLIGRQVIAASEFPVGEGTVQVGDSVWSARTVGNARIPEGATVEIIDLDGATLIVKLVG